MAQELHLVPVTFSWEPDADLTKTSLLEVLITGSWNEFKPTKLQKNGDKWTTELSMPPGRYKYSFTVDGQVKHVTNLPFTVDPATGMIYNIINVSMTSLGGQGLAPNRLKLLEGEEFSQFEPLTVRITNILRQYPDGSQILKELLQNADDARAAHVKFVFDRRSFPSKKLFTDGMKLFQGPALYAYNSGVFEEKDFESIRRLGSSRKKNELGKTGRFGIGFNSIYHITDLPSFVSGKHLVMLDPHARYLPGESQSCGKRWDYLECPEVTTIFEDQVAPYKMLNCDMKSFFNGTIFRFPLRTEEVSPFSQISKFPYTEEKVEELFASFKKEGSAVLLFLKFVESVELYTWDKGDAEPKHYYSVVIKNAEKQNPITLNTVRTDRKVMYDSVSQGLSYLETMAGKERSYVIPLDVEVKDGAHENNESWMLCNQIGGGKSSEMAMQEFKAAQGLRLVPWGGVATKSIFTKESVKGRVFCFLPLPTETGLPVHVNGCFELSLNRRDVWHGEDLSGEGKKKVDWNNRLKQDVVGSSYAALIEQTAVSIAKTNQLEYLIQFYEQWPNIKSTNSYWNDLSESVYSYLIKNQAKVLYSHSKGGQWVSASEAVFVYSNEDVHSTPVSPTVFKTVVQALIDENIPVVEVTSGLFEAFSHALGKDVKFVSPALVRGILKTNWATVPTMYQKNRSLVVHLLEYCLADRNFEDLRGINLVPMADGSFSKFENKNQSQIYLATDLEMSLFPNHLSMFVDSNIVSPTINAELKSSELREVVNVTIVDPKTVSQLFEHVLPKEWKNSYLVEWSQSFVSKGWLERFWQYLTFLTMNGNEKPETDFEQWPLVPCMGQRLCSLHPNTPCLLSHSSLSADVITALAKLHCYVVDESEITLNNKILSNIFPAGDAAGVLNALTRCIKNANKPATELFVVLSSDEKTALKRFFSKYEWFENKVLNSSAQRDDLKQLPIFETFSKDQRFAAIDRTQYACPPENIPHDISSEYLLKRDSPHDKYLLEFLEISVLKRPEFYKSYLTEKLSSFTQEHRDQVMLYVLEDLNAIIKEDPTGEIADFLSNTEFIPDSNGRLCPPRYLFDPEETDMNHMFTFEPVFPTGPYKDPAMLSSLRKLGLKKQLGVKDFIDRIKSVPSYYKQDEQAALLRAKSLCAYLDRNFSMLETELSAEDFEVFTKELSATEWLPSIAPAHFVSNYMKLNIVANDVLSEFNCAFWFVGEPRLVAPNITCLQRDALLSCGSRAILDYHPKNPYFIKTFNWVNPPSVEVVVDHTKKLASTASVFNVEGERGSKLSSFISTISDRVNEYLNNALSTGQITKNAFDKLLDADCKWIWVAPFFAKKTQIVKELSIDLSPYIFSCPRDLKKYPNLYSTLDFKGYVEPEDLVNILKEIHALRANDKTPLTEHELKLCLSTVTLLSDSIESVKDIPNGLVLPSQSGYLMAPSKLVYDDMPWVKSLDIKTPENHQIIHQSIPNQIAKALGIRPCTLVIISTSIDPIKDQDGDVSPNKKLSKISEAIHTRSQARILTEMIQNADDAGANEFVVILDDTQHKDQSLFSPKMKEHQGPALYIYNNATFRPEDFENICATGRSAKRGDISKIGKLGIGFSTLFHLSDLPSFVSGNYAVFCDAYTSHLPGSNSHHPYVRFNLQSSIVSLFPDQFATFNFMGCDVAKGYFPGTLFRVPLRQVLKGKESRLPGSIVSVDKVRKLIGRFMGQATSHLAFLNRIKKIETFQNEADHLRPWFTAEIENFTPELEKFRGKPKDIASFIDTQLTAIDDGDEEDITVEDSSINNTNEPEPGDKQKRTKKKKRAVKKVVSVNPLKRKLDVPVELQRETQVLNIKITKRAEGESTSEKWLLSQYFDATYVNKVLTSKTKISGLRLPYSIVAARLPADTKDLDQREYTKKKAEDNDKEEKETSNGKLFYYVPLDIATGLPVQIHSNFDLTPEKNAIITTEEAEWNRVLRDTSVLGAYVHFIKGLQGCITRGEVKKSQYYDFWPATSSTIDQFWHPMIQSFYQVLAKQACLFSFMDANTLIAPFESVFPNELILHKNTAKLVDILKKIKFPLADAPEVIYQQFKYHSVNEIQQLSPLKLRNFLRKMANETGKTYWTYDEFVINSRESAVVLLSYCLESSKLETILPTIKDDTDFKRQTSKNQKLKLQKAKKRQNWDTSQLDEEETHAIIQGLIGLPLCCLHNNAITVFGGQLKYMIDSDINTIVELIENLPAFKRTLINIDVSKILRDFKLSRKVDLAPASVTNFGVTEFMENFHLILPKEWRGREEINWNLNDISEAWLRKFWSVAKGKWSSLPNDWPIIPTEDFKLVSRGRAEYIFIPPSELDLKGAKLRLFEIMTKLQAMFLNIDICPPTNETRKMCLNIKAEDVLLALRRVKPEHCDMLTSQDRSFLLETLSQAVSIERIAMEAKILKRLPLFETESETNPDYLVNLCADVICDHPTLFKNIPAELREQLEEYGKTRFVAPQEEYFMMPPDVPSTSLNSKFLKFKPKLQQLYTCLGISAANKGHFLKKYVLPNYQSLSSGDQIKMLDFIKNNMVTLNNEIKHFDDLMSVFEFIPTRAGYARRGVFLHDPTNAVFAFLYSDIPENFPDVRISSKEWVHFLRDNFSLNSTLSEEHLLSAALKYSTLPFLSVVQLRRLVELIQLCYQTHVSKGFNDVKLFKNLNLGVEDSLKVYESLADDVVASNRKKQRNKELNRKTQRDAEAAFRSFINSFINKAKNIQFVPCQWDSRLTNMPNVDPMDPSSIILQRMDDIALPEHRSIIWTVSPIFHPDIVPNDAVRAIWSLEPPSVTKVIQHINNLMVQGDRFKYKSGKQLQKDLKAAFKYISERLEEVKKDPKSKEYQDLVSIIREQLGTIACVVVDESGLAVLPRQLFFKFHKSGQDGDSSSQPSTDFRPFFYRLPRKLSKFEELFRVAGAKIVPDIDNLLDVLTQMADKKKNNALNPNQLDLTIRILRYCSQLRILQPENHERYFAASVPVILAPDTYGRLKPCSELIFDDSSWLHHRINMEEFALAHKYISQFIASQMHIQSLSEIVEEIFDPKKKVESVKLTDAARFTATISASQFCEGLLRISLHELTRRKSEKIDVSREVKKLERKASQLSKFKVVIVPTIHSQFIDTKHKRNVTKDSQGTNCLLDEHTETIYLIETLPKAVKYEELLVIEINRYLGHFLRNLLPLQSILTCDPSDILSVLNHYKIDQKGAGNFAAGLSNKSYGTPLTSEQKQSLTFSPLLPLTVDETVAWKNKDDNKFYYGVIKSIDSEDREFLTDVTLEAGDVTLTISSIYVYKFVDEMHPEAPIHLVGKMLDKLLKEVEVLGERKDKHVTEIQREIVHRVHERWAHSSEITSLVKKIEFALDM